ncbi:glycosyl hydrolase 108 family protein [Emticicia sp. 21SJ11W-3]|uniref:glycosyl hydrolase 108 family protein n=1 Tax=Emticicia sp. 21SJ11W-3 TaxID=2916755 RepID=UPI00209E6823|nr:hypothetical protein [Emticicia sp. 21SJ11W-3]UTA70128.1 hypothetical protein MB380_09975 [Emticicia sp. 21SJ11W-3]
MKQIKLMLLTGFMVSMTIITSEAASFEKYFQKLIRFEGKGYGINKRVWGKKTFTKAEAFKIHRKHYWNKYHGNLFKSQEVAEILIDQIITAGEGVNRVNIRAFEAIIGAPQDGRLSIEDVELANSFFQCEYIVNPYMNYRLHYYGSRKNASRYPGWTKRAKAFGILDEEKNMLADFLILPDILMAKDPEVSLDDKTDKLASKLN